MMRTPTTWREAYSRHIQKIIEVNRTANEKEIRAALRADKPGEVGNLSWPSKVWYHEIRVQLARHFGKPVPRPIDSRSFRSRVEKSEALKDHPELF